MIANTNKPSRLMLQGGVLAGPIYILVGAAQVLTREGFDITRHPLSFMSLGGLGWIQITNFVLTGLLVLLAAVAARRHALGDKRQRRAAVLIGIYGLCVVGGGVFLPDPSLGFPPGTPDAYPESFSWHALLHFISGMLGFLSLIAASLVYARHFAAGRRPGWTAFSALTGVTFLTALVATGASGNAVWALILLYLGVALGWLWLSAIFVHVLKAAQPGQGSKAEGANKEALG